MSCSVSAQPFGSSYFLPGKLAGKAETFLLDTRCTTNLLSWHLVDTLHATDRENLDPYEGQHSVLEDGLCILFNGEIRQTGRVRDQVTSETFIVSQLMEEAIMGMLFLRKDKCHIDINKLAVMLARCEILCG